MKRIAVLTVVLLTAFAAKPAYATSIVVPEVADLDISFTCKAVPPRAAFAVFLQGEGFHFLPKGAAEGPEFIAGDKWRREIEMTADPDNHGYALMLTSPPPTVHDKALENRMLAFIQRLEGCTATGAQSGTNDESVAVGLRNQQRFYLSDEIYAVCNKTWTAYYNRKRCASDRKALRALGPRGFGPRG